MVFLMQQVSQIMAPWIIDMIADCYVGGVQEDHTHTGLIPSENSCKTGLNEACVLYSFLLVSPEGN